MSQIILCANNKPQIAILFIAIIIGLFIGKLLYYVINTLPTKLMNTWRLDSQEFLFPNITNNQKTNSNPTKNQFSIKNNFSWRSCFPIIDCFVSINKILFMKLTLEIFTSLCTVLIIYLYGVNLVSIALCILFWFLIPLAIIDVNTQLLPDELTLTLLWLGLLINSFNLITTSQHAIVGAVAGYISLWLVYMIFKLFTGKEGIGYGDFKLFASFGAWFGVMKLPLILFVASLAGTLFGVLMVFLRKFKRSTAFPFGPFLITAVTCIVIFSY